MKRTIVFPCGVKRFGWIRLKIESPRIKTSHSILLVKCVGSSLVSEEVKEDEFSHLLDSCTKTWENLIIYLLPIIPRLDIDNYIVNRANDSINLIDWFSKNLMKAKPDKFQAIVIGPKTNKHN
jgi:hypothetical protein